MRSLILELRRMTMEASCKLIQASSKCSPMSLCKRLFVTTLGVASACKLKFALPVAIAPLLISGGCAYTPRPLVGNASTEFNVIAEESNNKVILLNILRAAERKPLLFTSFDVLRGGFSTVLSTGTPGFGFGPYANPAQNKYNILGSATFAASPSFDVKTLETDKFYRGFLRPIPPELFAFYLETRWRPDLLFLMTIDSVTDDKKQEFTASPFVVGGYMEFLKNVRETLGCPKEDIDKCPLFVTTIAKGSSTCIPLGTVIGRGATPPVISTTDAISLAKSSDRFTSFSIVDGASEKCSSSELIRPSFFLVKQEHQLVFSATSGARGGQGCSGLRVYFEPSDPSERIDRQLWSPRIGSSEVPRSSNPQSTNPKSSECTVRLRSPESMIYYLGELARIQLAGDDLKSEPPLLDVPSDKVALTSKSRERCKAKLIEVKKLSKLDQEDRFDVVVQYMNGRYGIPRNMPDESGAPHTCPSRSMQVLKLIQQVIMLQRSADELPKTGAVISVGGVR